MRVVEFCCCICSSIFRRSLTSPLVPFLLSDTQGFYCSCRCFHLFLFSKLYFTRQSCQHRTKPTTWRTRVLLSVALFPQSNLAQLNMPWTKAPAIIALGVTRARKPPRHDKAQHQGREKVKSMGRSRETIFEQWPDTKTCQTNFGSLKSCFLTGQKNGKKR